MFPRHLRDKLDFDYLGTLDPAASAWLAQFVDEYYQGDFRRSAPGDWSQEERRRVWREKHASERDVQWCADELPLPHAHSYDEASGWGAAVDLDAYHPGAPGAPDQSPSPEYLDSGEYADALAEFRRLVDTKPRTPRVERRLEVLQRYLSSIASHGDPEE
jgi:hypothetical protein